MTVCSSKNKEVIKMPQEVIKKNHMDVAWHEYTDENGENIPVSDASIAEKASIIGRVGIMFLSCGTGAWRVRSSMNTLAEALGITCTADIGLMSIEYTCYDGEEGFTQSLCLTNTGVNTLKLNRLEHFIRNFKTEGKHMSGEQLHTFLDNIEKHMVSIPRLHWDLQQQSHAVDLHFCWEAVRLRCSVHLWVQELVIIFAVN